MYNGETYYADKEKIEQYDKTLIAAAKRNIIVHAIVLVYPESWSKDKSVGRILEYPEYDTAGIYTLPNMTDVSSVNLYAAAIDFLAARYSRPDKKYGHIHRWIIHNEIDSAWIWCNAGNKSEIEFTNLYIKSMRMVYYTAIKYNGNAEVLISLTHHWNSKYDEKYFYKGKDIAKLMLDFSRAEGDFKWGVAYHPYPEILWEPKSWLDEDAADNDNTKLITFKNIEVLDAWIKKTETFYKSRQRTLVLSEQNPNSVDYSEKAFAEQAASLAYVWKKLSLCTGIEAYIAHSWIDSRLEGGLKTGLRKYPDDKDEPYAKKTAWYVYRGLGTKKENKIYEEFEKIIDKK